MTVLEQGGQFSLMANIISGAALFGGSLFDILVNEKT